LGSFSIIDGLATVATPEAYARLDEGWTSTGGELGAEVRGLASALVGYGLAPGGRVAVLGSEGCETLTAQLAVIVAGGCLVLPEPGLSDAALADALGASEIAQAVAADEDQLARLLALRPDLPTLELVVLMKARPSERKPAALLASTAIAAGEERLRHQPDLLRSVRGSSNPAEAAVLFWRSAGASQAMPRSLLEGLAERLATVIQPARERAVLMALEGGTAARLALGLAVASKDGTLLLADPKDRPDSGLDERPAHAVVLSFQAVGQLEKAWREDIDRRSLVSRLVARWSLRQPRRSERGRWKRRLAELLVLRELRSTLGPDVRHLDVVRQKLSRLDPMSEAFFESIGLPVRYFEGSVHLGPGPAIAP